MRAWWANERVSYSIRTLISLLGVLIPCWYLQAMAAVTPLVLGVIAAALAETDDSLAGKVRQFVMLLICFAIASLSVELLFEFPALFAIGLTASSFGFIMLGAVGRRYASIAFASLLLAVYTMLGANQSQDLWTQPLLLLAAAVWHCSLSLLWHLLWPNQPVQQSLAQVFAELKRYLAIKADLFEPVAGYSSHPRRLQLARQNTQVVTALNEAKQTLLNRVRQGRPSQADALYLKHYFLAQDIHERASSSHYRYADLNQAFRHSDILFRFQSVLRRQAACCGRLGEAIRTHAPYQHDPDATLALDEANQSLLYLRNQHNPDWLEPLTSLKYLLRNLATVERHFANANDPDVDLAQDSTLTDPDAHSTGEMWQRLQGALTPNSLLFRHAVRVSLSLLVGYGLIQLLELERGYWVLLTILFVLQSSFSATRQRLLQRMLGTLGGLLAGIPLLYLIPGQEGQLVLMVACGVAFFATRTRNYGLATGFITLLVLFCFSQLGEGYAVILPRLADTLLGCGIAALAVRFVLPDWQVRRLPKVMATAVTANRDYLSQIIAQYRIGKRDSLAYREARRQAHNNDAQLSVAISNMLQEPGRFRHAVDESFRFLVLNHALLGYVSALGAHRDRVDDPAVHQLVNLAYAHIHQGLDHVSEILTHKAALPCQPSASGIENKLGQWRSEQDELTRLILQQLFMIHRMLDEMTALAMTVAGCELSAQRGEEKLSAEGGQVA